MAICLQAEFLAGTTMEQVVSEAKALAIKLDLAYVKFNFNGINISVGKTADVEYIKKEFEGIYDKPHKFIVSN